MRPTKLILKALLWVLMAMMAAWGILALLFFPVHPEIRLPSAVIFGIFSLLCLTFLFKPRKMKVLFFVLFAIVLASWLSIPPSNTKNWQPDVAVLPWAEINGNHVTIHNIRNCEYRTETDYTPRYYDKKFDISKMTGADFYMVYWGSPLIAHTMMSFGFEGGDQVCFSIETRKEVGEEYSALKGFFRQYELTYVVADERDLVRLRTNFRNEDVYLYRPKASIEMARKVFLDYLREVNSLKAKPEWYNALTSNCTTNIRKHIKPYSENPYVDWRLIVNGYLDQLMYEKGTMGHDLPFDELKKRSHINEKAHKIGNDPEFSRLIRIGLP